MTRLSKPKSAHITKKPTRQNKERVATTKKHIKTRDVKPHQGPTHIVLFNKPFDVLSQFTDEGNRKTLADFIDIKNWRILYITLWIFPRSSTNSTLRVFILKLSA